MARVNGSTEVINELRKSLLTSARNLVTLSDDLKKTVSILQMSDYDASLDEFEEKINSACSELGARLQDIALIDKKMQDYSQFLEKRSDLSGKGNSSSESGTAARTGQMWSLTDEGMMFDSPDKLAPQMNTNQGVLVDNKQLGEAAPGSTEALNTCGLCSAQNVLSVFGRKASEEEIYIYARKNGLCELRGETSLNGIVKVLNGFGMPAHREAADTGRIAKAVENGHLVIIAVEVSEYYEGVLEDGLHALTVTSVIADAEGMPTQLVICDSNGGGANRIPVETIERALCGDMIVTDIIR